MKKRILALSLVPAFVLTLVAGCGNKNRVFNYEDSKDKITRITFFGNKYEAENVEVIEAILSGFMEENPDIQVTYESMKGNSYQDALNKRMAAGKGNDVFMVNHDTLLKLEEHSQVADLSKLSAMSQYTDQMSRQMDEDGKIYWVPTTVSGFGLYCNLDLLDKHHQEVPGTLKEWETVCDYFVEQGITPIVANNDISLKTLAIGRGFYSVYQENQEENVFRSLNTGEEKLSTYLTDGFSIVKDFIDKGYVDAGKALDTQKTSGDLEEFVEGTSPFMLTGAWAAGRVKKMEPDFAFQVVPLPILEDGSLLVINADTRLSVNADSENIEAAKKFVEYFIQRDNIREFVDQQSSFSPLKNGYPSSAEVIRPLISSYESGQTVIGTDGRLDLPIWNLTAQASVMLLSGESLSDTMKWIDQQAEGKE